MRATLIRVFLIALTCVLPLAASGPWLRTWLFETVSYSNSISLDSQLNGLRAASATDLMFIGSSEVRWGAEPRVFASTLAAAGVHVNAFNFGWDGFNPGLMFRVFQALDPKQLAPNLRMLVIGINLGENDQLPDDGWLPGVCGALQRPVLTSPFGTDHGLTDICTEPTLRNRLIGTFELAGLFRYRQQLRQYLLGTGPGSYIPMQSNGLPHHDNGFQPHQSLAEARRNFELDWQRVQQQRAEHPERYAPLEPGPWERMVAPGGYFDRWLAWCRERDLALAIFALPTSPLWFEAYDRRLDYARNSELLAQWADSSNVAFVDLGIQDQLDRDHHYSDHRHLSRYGAPDFSRRLAAAFATQPAFRDALSSAAGR